MLAKFLPKQKTFFKLFNQAADKLVDAAKAFHQLVLDLQHVETHAHTINDLEHRGDEVALLSYQLLHKTFITPFDRHDIHMLTTQLDDILDRINRLAQRFVIYQFTTIPHEFIQLAELGVQVTMRVRTVVAQLDSLKNQAFIIQNCLDIDQLENDAEAILLQGVSKLFAEENDFKHLLKLKELYEQFKEIINACQDAANLVKSIVLEYA